VTGLPQAPTTRELKECCAALYDAPPVRWLLGDELHPGGRELTLRAAALAGIRPGSRVLDVASGEGSTARLLAGELEARVTGLEYGKGAVRRARELAELVGIGDRVVFVRGDAERLPFASSSFDAVICECSLCLFPAKEAAAAEMARVLRPGGRAAVADVVATFDDLPPALRNAAARVACVADARPLADYTRLLEDAGLELRRVEAHGDALEQMIDRVEARLRVARMGARASDPELEANLALGTEFVADAQAAVRQGTLDYALLVAERPRFVGVSRRG
jgi:arsenite methyltransferase